MFVVLILMSAACDRQWRASLEDADWSLHPPANYPAHPWGRYLKDRRIGIDPGHGGISKEANPHQALEGPINLGVALHLKEFLERDGAEVIMTRERDLAVPLAQRPKIIESQGAAVFVSIHHNAISKAEINYTSTFYHADPDREPACLDLARAIQKRVLEALRTPHRVPTPVLSDALIYPDSGFRVLRLATIPAILCEGSFYTHEAELQRLRKSNYQRREAYGYYLGLVDYFAQGTPGARLLEVGTGEGGEDRWLLRLALDDGVVARGGWGSDEHRVLPSSILCRFNGERVPFEYDSRRALLTVSLRRVARNAQFELRFENIYKHSNFPTRYQLTPRSKGEVGFIAERNARAHTK